MIKVDDVDDVTALCNLLETVPNLETKINIFTVNGVKERLIRLNNEKKNLPSFDSFISSRILSKTVSKQLAASGLNKCQLETVCNRSGIDGLCLLLKDRIHKPSMVAHQLFDALHTGS